MFSFQKYVLPFSFVLIILAACSSPAEARDHRITDVRVEADVRPDGSVRITEHRTFLFDGAFSWFEQRIEARGFSRIEDIAVSEDENAYRLSTSEEPGTFTSAFQNGTVVIRLYYDAEDESRTFTLNYTLYDAVASDGSWDEFAWTFIGGGWETASEQVSIRITLPESVAQDDEPVFAFHQQRNGPVQLETEPASVDFSMENLRGGRSLRIQTIFPAGHVTTTVDAPGDISPYGVLQQIEEAAERHARLEEEAGPLRTLAIALAVFSFLFAVFMVRRHGQSSVPKPDLPDHADRPPHYMEPALVGWLFRNVSSTHQARFSASIFDLARKGYFRLVQVEDEKADAKKDPVLAIERTDKSIADNLKNWEVNLIVMLESRLDGGRKPLNKLFAGKDNFGSSSEFSSWWHQWFTDIGKEARSRNWIKVNIRPMLLLILVQLLLTGIGIGLLIYLSDVTLFPGLLLTITAGLGLCAVFLLHIRTEEGQKIHYEWRAYREALNAGNVSDAPEFKADHIIYAITLGISEKKLNGIIETIRPDDQDLTWLLLLPGLSHNPALFSSAVTSASGSISSFGTSTSFSTGSTGAIAGTAGGGGGGSVG